jgi:hypothetical protein
MSSASRSTPRHVGRVGIAIGVMTIVGIGSGLAYQSARSDGTAIARACAANEGRVVNRAAMAQAVDEDRQSVHRSAGNAKTEIRIADWEPETQWAFVKEAGSDPDITYEGLYQLPDQLDITTTYQRDDRRTREVIARERHWIESSSAPIREFCVQSSQQVPAPGLRLDASTTDPALPEAEQKSIPLRLAAGNRLVVDPGTPVTLDNGDPGTAYVWVPEEAPWIRVDFTVDGQNRLRGGTVQDTARQKVNERLTLTPTDRTVTDPTGQPVIGRAH